jgi:LPS O-antigen subunit length determinant protein (WzzB/FepE family)
MDLYKISIAFNICLLYLLIYKTNEELDNLKDKINILENNLKDKINILEKNLKNTNYISNNSTSI